MEGDVVVDGNEVARRRMTNKEAWAGRDESSGECDWVGSGQRARQKAAAADLAKFRE